MPPKATSERAPKCSPPPVAQQVAAVFSIDVSFRQARRLLPALPQKTPVRLLAPVFDLVASRQCSGWALPFSLPLGRSVPALLLKPAAARVQVQCLALGPLRQFSRLIRPFSFSICEFESSRRSEIDPEDSPKSPPVLASAAHRRSKHQCTQRRRSRCGQAWRKCPPHVSNVNSRGTMKCWGARAPRPLCHAPRGTLLGSLFGGAPKRAGGAPALPRAA